MHIEIFYRYSSIIKLLKCFLHVIDNTCKRVTHRPIVKNKKIKMFVSDFLKYFFF